jgi:OmcA/MtrC family decaheme c-type cytochrome
MGTTRWYRGTAATVAALAAAALFVGACGDDDDDDDGGTTPPPEEPAVDPDPLNLEIQSATLPAEAGGRPTVTFRVTDGAGAPVDVAAEIGNYIAEPRVAPNVSPRFTVAMLEDDGDYLSYYQNDAASPPSGYVVPPDLPLPPGNTPGPVTQATSTPSPSATNFVATDLVSQGNGVYVWTLPATSTTVTGLDPTKTHTVAGWVVRTHLSGDSDVAYDSLNWVPTGGATVQLDQTITDEGCNKCHGVLQAHGTRRGTQICMTCHSPQTSDPETGRTVDFKVMIHKIHAGSSLASVAPLSLDPPGEGFPYYIVGNRGSIHDWSDVAFPWHDGVSHCTACHQGEDQDNWKNKPTLAACGACHDNVRFDGSGIRNCDFADDPAIATSGNWYDACNHPDISSLGDVNGPTICATCHTATTPELAVDNPAFHHGELPP